jgi:serine/threonine protein kinase
LNQPIGEAEVWRIGDELSEALRYLHENKIIHRDVKTLNVFLTKDNRVKVGEFLTKLGDMGVSKIVQNVLSVQNTRVGTPLYLAPELVKQKPYDYKIDVWAMGCILYQMCAMKSPFHGENLISLGYNIVHHAPDPIPTKYSPELIEFIAKLLEKNPSIRPSSSEVCSLLSAARAKQKILQRSTDPLNKITVDSSKTKELQLLKKNTEILPQEIHKEPLVSLSEQRIAKPIEFGPGSVDNSESIVNSPKKMRTKMMMKTETKNVALMNPEEKIDVKALQKKNTQQNIVSVNLAREEMHDSAKLTKSQQISKPSANSKQEVDTSQRDLKIEKFQEKIESEIATEDEKPKKEEGHISRDIQSGLQSKDSKRNSKKELIERRHVCIVTNSSKTIQSQVLTMERMLKKSICKEKILQNAREMEGIPNLGARVKPREFKAAERTESEYQNKFHFGVQNISFDTLGKQRQTNATIEPPAIDNGQGTLSNNCSHPYLDQFKSLFSAFPVRADHRVLKNGDEDTNIVLDKNKNQPVEQRIRQRPQTAGANMGSKGSPRGGRSIEEKMEEQYTEVKRAYRIKTANASNKLEKQAFVPKIAGSAKKVTIHDL